MKRPADEAGPPPDLTPENRSYVEAWVGEEIQRLQALSYEELVRHEGQGLHCQRPTPSGVYVMRETSVFWDDP